MQTLSDILSERLGEMSDARFWFFVGLWWWVVYLGGVECNRLWKFGSETEEFKTQRIKIQNRVETGSLNLPSPTPGKPETPWRSSVRPMTAGLRKTRCGRNGGHRGGRSEAGQRLAAIRVVAGATFRTHRGHATGPFFESHFLPRLSPSSGQNPPSSSISGKQRAIPASSCQNTNPPSSSISGNQRTRWQVIV